MPNCRYVKAEFTVSKFGCGHLDSSPFLSSSWDSISLWTYTIYRILLAVLLLAFTAWDCAHVTALLGSERWLWIMFASNWALLLLCLLYLCWTGMTFLHCVTDGRIVVCTGFLWIVYVVATNSICVTAAFYWLSLYSQTNDPIEATKHEAEWSFHLQHSLPLVFVCLDLVFTRVPIRVAHALYPLLASAVYLLADGLFEALHSPLPCRRSTISDQFGEPRVTTSGLEPLPLPCIQWSAFSDALATCGIVALLVLTVHGIFYLVYATKSFTNEQEAE